MIEFAVLGVPLAAGVAILRYRLYDIDVVVNRALVYGALTAALAGAYLAWRAPAAVGRRRATDRPRRWRAPRWRRLALSGRRGRIQSAVDRRFFRRRYDATRTLEAFGGRLRAEVDLATLTEDLRR